FPTRRSSDLGEAVELERVCRGNERPIDQMRLHHASELAPKAQTALPQSLSMPAALGLFGKCIETLGDIGRGSLCLLQILQNLGTERAGNRGLLNDKARISAVHAL